MKKSLFMAPFAGLLMAACASDGTSAGAASSEEADGSKAVIENIMTRTSIRKFKVDREISKDTLETLLKAGMAAPTAVNKQPWAFVTITDRGMLDSLQTVSPNYRLETAAAAIVVCGDLSKALEGASQEYWVQDCSAATENILLAAHGLGLGAVWCGVYPAADRVKAVSATLGLPENIVPLDVICLGYPDEDPMPKDKWDPANVHWNKW